MRATLARMRAVVVMAVALIAVSLVASCWGDHDNQMHGGAGRAPQTPALSDASQVNVEIVDYDFSSRELAVQAGVAITWTNRDRVPHDATDAAGAWATGTLWQGESATIVFESPGAYEYLCTIHPNMKGTLTVGRAM